MAQDPDNPHAREMRAHALAQVGAALIQGGTLEEARATYAKAIAEFDWLEDEYPQIDRGARGGIQARLSFGGVGFVSRDGPLLERLSREGLERTSDLRNFDPDDAQLIRLEASLHHNLAAGLRLQTDGLRDPDRSRELLQAAIASLEASKSGFLELQERGALLGREAHVLDQLDEVLAETRAALPEDAPEGGR